MTALMTLGKKKYQLLILLVHLVGRDAYVILNVRSIFILILPKAISESNSTQPTTVKLIEEAI
jgi:hypothetical protein